RGRGAEGGAWRGEGAGGAIFCGHIGRGVWKRGTSRGRTDVAEGSARVDGTNGRAVGRSRTLPPQRRTPAAAVGGASRRGGSVFPPGTQDRPKPKRQILGTPRRHKPCHIMAQAREVPGRLCPAGSGVRVVHRRL